MNKQEQIQLGNVASPAYEIYPLLKQRYSPRTFRDEKIEDRELKQLFEAARWAASSYNLQPWRFIYAEKGSDAYDKIMDCLIEFNRDWAKLAPILMLSIYKDKKEDGSDYYHALHDLGLSLGNMTTQAQYLGIALHHMAGVDRKKAGEVFAVPEGYRVATAIALGYYGGHLDWLPEDLQDREVADRERIPQEDFAFRGGWKDVS
ncbi:MAG: nitroreductase family protein [Robiginitalea sp.]